MIPKQDIIAGLPIRWAFTYWRSGPGGWKFEHWRDYLLRMEESGAKGNCIHDHDCVSTKKIFRIFDEPDFMWSTRKFLECNNASTLAGFIRFYQECLEQYKAELKESGLI